MIRKTAMEKTGRTFLYFGFGSNLWSKRIRLENPSAEFVAVAELADYQLQFRYPSKVRNAANELKQAK